MKNVLKVFLMLLLFVTCTSGIFAQRTVTGTVLDADKQPVVGANVVVKGTTIGTMTDVDGKFSINVPSSSSSITVSFIGFVPQDFAVGNNTVINITLESEATTLSEVVVIGYGTLKKSDLTGSISSIKSSDIVNNKSPNVLQALQGKAAGLDITQSSGQAGSSVNLTLRGNRSITAGNSPLILVDGVEYGSMIDINSSDIESIEVLKDGSSTAIYGTKGANGVILVTTKKGGDGKTNISYNTYLSFNSPNYLPDISNSAQFIQKRLETKIADEEDRLYNLAGIAYNATTGKVTWNQVTYPNPTSVFGTVTNQTLIDAYNVLHPTAPISNPNNLITSDPTSLQLMADGVSLDYLDMIFVNSVTQNHELSITGGDKKTAFNFSLGLMNDKGLLRNDEMRKYNVKLGVDHQIFNQLKIGASILFTNKKYNKRNSSIFNQALKTGTIGVLYNTDGSYADFPDKTFTFAQPNPMLDEVAGSNVNEIMQNRIFGSTYLNWTLFKGLTFKSNFGLDLNFTKTGVYRSPKSLAQLNAAKSLAQMTNASSWAYTWDNTLNYQKKFGQHDIQLLAGSSTMANSSDSYFMQGENQTTPSTQYYYWSGFATTTSSSSFSASQMVSFFGRVNYKFREKYLFQATYRADGSSVLAEGNKWYSFPSASLGWKIKEESFLKDVNFIDNLKLRLGWGKSGNASINPYSSLTLIGTTPIYYTIDDVIYSSLAPGQAGNPDLKWETTTTTDLGLDFSILNNRISGAVDLYLSKTSDLLFQVPFPTTSVYPTMTANVAGSKNKGIEVSINTANFRTSSFEWNTDWIFSMNKEEITRLREGVNELIQTSGTEMWRVGSPVNTYYSYKRLGNYSIEDLNAELEYIKQQTANGDTILRGKIPMVSNKFYPGDIKLQDVDGNGIFDANDKVLYNESPKFTFSINNNFLVKTNFGDFGLSALIVGRVGQYIDYGLYGAYKPGTQTAENGAYFDSWTPTNTGAAFPRYSTSGNSSTASFYDSFRFIDGSFVKIKDITLSYTLPAKISNLAHISSLRVFGTAKNYLVFSKVDNFDPEIGGTMNFPLAKQIIIGLNVNF
jgi:TonB-linked SusC/RagA family outer membrane protein